jgi:shikimate kinase
MIVLFGISTSGKSTLGEVLAKNLGYHWIDIDTFYKKEKPKITLRGVPGVENWDTIDAINEDNLIAECKWYKNVVLSAFIISDPLLKKITHNYKIFLLKTGSNAEEEKERCIASRIVSKRFKTQAKQDKDRAMVEDILYTAYQDALTKLETVEVINVYDCNGERKSVKDLIEQIESRISS